MIENKNHILEKFFSERNILLKNFWLVWYEVSMGVHTNDDGNKKHFKERILFQESAFSRKCFENNCYHWE